MCTRLLIALITLGLFTCAPAMALEPTRASDIVTLEAVSGLDVGTCAANPTYFLPYDFVRNLPNGDTVSFSKSAASPPPGQVLVVTGVDWQVASGTANTSLMLRLFVVNRANPGAFHTRAFESTIQLSGNGTGGTSEVVRPGIVVSPAATICADIQPVGGPSGTEIPTLLHLLLRGFLADK